MHDLDLTGHWTGILSLVIFVIAYLLVVLEEATHMQKSKPVMMAAGLIWALIGIACMLAGQGDAAHAHAREIVEEYGELSLFLIVAITYVNTLEERRAFKVLRVRLIGLGLGYRQLFLLTGVLAFFLSGVLDNLTTALVMGAVALALGRDNPRFVAIGCVSIVVAANAGGAFSPFGDITTLMVWQKGKLEFFEFFALFVPSVVNWAVPATIMYFAVPDARPAPTLETVTAKPGMIGVAVLFALTIATAVAFKNFLNLPPALGMMLGSDICRCGPVTCAWRAPGCMTKTWCWTASPRCSGSSGTPCSSSSASSLPSAASACWGISGWLRSSFMPTLDRPRPTSSSVCCRRWSTTFP